MSLRGQLPPIPEIADEDLRQAVSCLCRAATHFHQLFAAVPPKRRALILKRFGDLLDDDAVVIEAWRDHLGHTVDDLLDDVEGDEP